MEYAGRGWLVFPLAPDSKVPLKDSHGYHDATVDRDQILSWWAQHPDANVAIRMGKVSGIVAIDIDPKNGGDTSLAEIERTFEPFPETLTATTPSGGKHYLFTYPERLAIASNTGVVAAGIDVRADDGYIVASPSSVNGKSYSWSMAGIAALPSWLLGMLYKPVAAGLERPAAPSSPAPGNQGKPNQDILVRFIPPPKEGKTASGTLTSESVQAAYQHPDLRIQIAKTMLNFDVVRLTGEDRVSFRSPLRADKHPSGGLMVADGGRLVFKDFRENITYSMPSLRAAIAYSNPQIKLGRSEYFMWALRLLHEAGLIIPAAVDDLPPCPEEACEGVRKVYEGFKLLVGLQRCCKDAYTKTAFAKRFAAAWCDVSEATAHRSRLRLMELGILSLVGVHNEDKPGRKQCGLFVPGKVRHKRQNIPKRLEAAYRRLKGNGQQFSSVDLAIDALALESGIERSLLTYHHGHSTLKHARLLKGSYASDTTASPDQPGRVPPSTPGEASGDRTTETTIRGDGAEIQPLYGVASGA